MRNPTSRRCATFLLPPFVPALCALAACGAAPAEPPAEQRHAARTRQAAATSPSAHRLEFEAADRAVARRTADGRIVWLSAQVVTLHNRGALRFPCLLDASAAWLRVPTQPGVPIALPQGHALEVEVEIDASAVPTTRGVHTAELSALNAFTFCREAAFEVTLIVDTPQAPVPGAVGSAAGAPTQAAGHVRTGPAPR
jgi:hypothetical protein